MDSPSNICLISAAMKGDIKTIEDAIARGQNLDKKRGRARHTALMIAACYGRETVVKKLLDAVANPNRKDKSGQTALFYATRFPLIFKMLLVGKADPNIQDKCGITVLMSEAMNSVSCISQSYKIALLLKHDACAELVDCEGHTAEYYALHFGCNNRIAKLIRKKNNKYEWGEIIVAFEKRSFKKSD